MLRSKSRFEEYYNQNLQNLNTNQFKDRLLIRQLLANAADLTADKNFRIMIPKNLIEEAQITKNITLIGLGSYIEVWDSDKYEAYKLLADQQLNTINEVV